MLLVVFAVTLAFILGIGGGVAAYIALDGMALVNVGADKAKELMTPRPADVP